VEVPERHNSVKVLLLLDVGGSMDEFAILCEQLFSAASSEFKYMEIFYFHNIFYESLWTSSTRSPESRIKIIIFFMNPFGPQVLGHRKAELKQLMY